MQIGAPKTGFRLRPDAPTFVPQFRVEESNPDVPVPLTFPRRPRPDRHVAGQSPANPQRRPQRTSAPRRYSRQKTQQPRASSRLRHNGRNELRIPQEGHEKAFHSPQVVKKVYPVLEYRPKPIEKTSPKKANAPILSISDPEHKLSKEEQEYREQLLVRFQKLFEDDTNDEAPEILECDEISDEFLLIASDDSSECELDFPRYGLTSSTSRCSGFELIFERKNGAKEFLDILSESDLVVTNHYHAKGPEILLKVEEFSRAFTRIVPSIHNGRKFVFNEIFAGCSRTSQIAEGLSFEVLHRMFGAELVFTEMEIAYRLQSGVPKLDYLCQIYGRLVGVSVTRAAHLKDEQRKGKITSREARHLLAKKIAALEVARGFVDEKQRWDCSLLHVWSATESGTRRLIRMYHKLLPLVNTPKPFLLLITTTSFPCPVAYSYMYGKE